MYDNRDAVDVGGLMFYGADVMEGYERGASFVDKILKGRKPADLPVEQPTKFELGGKSQNGETDRLDDSAERAGESRQGNQMTNVRHQRSGVSKSRSEGMSKKISIWLLATFLLATVSVSQAQNSANVPLIGFLSTGTRTTYAPGIEALRQGLRDLGYVEGKNIKIEYRFAEGKFERLAQLAQELVRVNVDVLVVSSGTVASAAKNATSTIPIIVVNAGDPIGRGLVASLAQPGGNVTGLYMYSPELLGKRLELLKEVVPKVFRFAFLADTANSGNLAGFEDARGAAKALGVSFQLIETKAPNPDIDGAFRFIVKERIGALIIESTPLMSLHQKRILELVEQNRIPAMHSEQQWANAGGLMSYGANRIEPYRRAAVYVDKILKGRKPADLPVEQPMKFEFIINLKAAKQIGLTIPPNVLARADRVIR